MTYVTTTTILFVLSLGAVHCAVNWSTLTADELKALPAFDFRSITADELASIPPQACQGFQQKQIMALPSTAATGLKAACLAEIIDGCHGFYPLFVGSMAPEAFAGWTSQCISNMQPLAFADVTSVQLTHINGSACSGFAYSAVMNFNPSSGSGLTAACLAQFTTVGCSALDGRFIATIKPEVFSAWTSECIAHLSVFAFAQVQSAQFAKINPSACSGFQYQVVNAFNPKSSTQLSAECLAKIPASDSSSGCAGLQRDFIGNMNPAAFAGWTAECISQLPTYAFSQVKSEQLALINSTACSGFSYGLMNTVNVASGAGLTGACLKQFTTSSDGCSGLQAAFVGEISPQAFSAFQPECIKTSRATTFSMMTKDQLAALPASSCTGFYVTHVSYFPPAAAPGLQKECLAQFTDACGGLEEKFVGQMTPVTFEGFTQQCVAVSPRTVFMYINSTQLSHIPVIDFHSLRSQHVRYIPDEAWTGSSIAQLSKLSTDGFSGFMPSALKIVLNMYTLELVNTFNLDQTYLYPVQQASEFKTFIPSQVTYMTEWETIAKDLSSVTWLKIALLKKGEQVQGPVFDSQTIQALPPSAFEGLRVDHVPLIAAKDFKLFNRSHTQYFTNDTVSVLTSYQLRVLAPEAFGALTPFSFSGMKLALIPAITGDQMKEITGDQLCVLTCNQLQAFTKMQLVELNEGQKQIFDQRYSSTCDVAAPPFNALPVPPIQVPVNQYQPQSSTDSPRNEIHPEPQSGTNGAKIAVIVVGVAIACAVIFIVGAAIFYFVRRARQRDPTRTPLIN